MKKKYTLKEEIEWKKTHLKNLIWSAKKKGSLFDKKDIPRFKKEIKKILKKYNMDEEYYKGRKII